MRIDNTVKLPVGDATDTQIGDYSLAHSVTDHTQTNWNGVVGRLELQTTDLVWVDDVQVYPDVARKVARLSAILGNASGSPVEGELTVEAASANTDRVHRCSPLSAPFSAPPLTGASRHRFELEYPLGDDMLAWGEFSPALYTLNVSLKARGDGRSFSDQTTVTFGMRDFARRGAQFVLNGKPVFLRGTLECCIFPLTGYPPTDVKPWRRIMDIIEAHGLNHLRFHSWCPPEAAFTAADEAGVMMQVEGPFWAEFGSNSELDAFAYAEGDRILQTYGNHPSFCLLALSNEPSGEHKEAFLAQILAHWRERDPRRLYTSGAGWPIIPENDYHCAIAPRSYAWGDGLEARFNAQPLSTRVDYRDFINQYDVPVVSHEIGEWTAYPNFEGLDKYAGVLKPYDLEAVRDSLAANGLAEQAEAFVMASGRLQTLLYKEEIEAALRTPGFGGFQLLDLHDYPGMGPALVGVLDAFWEGKGYVTPEEFRTFCSETVLLLRTDKVVWQQHETFEAAFEVAHFGPAILEDATLEWSLVDGESVLASGDVANLTIPYGSGVPLGRTQIPLADFRAPSQLSLRAKLKNTPYYNTWALWLYPQTLELPAGVHQNDQLDAASLQILQEGGRVLLTPRPETSTNDIPLGFTTPFWNTRWTAGQPPHTMGVLCDPEHPALRDFPTEFHSNWQWWEVLYESKCFVLEGSLSRIEPLIGVIDDYMTNRKLALAFEAQVGNGKLLVCGADLSTNLGERVVAKQLLYSLLTYMQGEEFEPATNLDPSSLSTLWTSAAPPP